MYQKLDVVPVHLGCIVPKMAIHLAVAGDGSFYIEQSKDLEDPARLPKSSKGTRKRQETH